MLKIVEKFILWFIPDNCVAAVARTWSTLPRRLFILLLTFTLFLVWDGFEHSMGCVQATLANIPAKGKLAWWSFDNLRLLGQFLASGVLSLLLALLTERLQDPQEDETESSVASLVHLLSMSGIDKIFPARSHIPITEQDYADAIRSEIATTNSLRILTLAGYEFLGKGGESLMFSTLKGRKDKVKLEAVLLDHTDPKCGAIIENRLRDLASRDDSYDEAQLKHHIDQTVTRLQKLAHDVSVYQIALKPAFRLILCDSCAFVSFYKSNAHGHESPVFRVRKREDGAGWYEAFCDLYSHYQAVAKKLN